MAIFSSPSSSNGVTVVLAPAPVWKCQSSSPVFDVVGDQVAVVVTDEQQATGGRHRAGVTGFAFEFVLPGDFAGAHVVGGDEARRVEAGGRRSCRTRCTFRLRCTSGRFGRGDQPERAALRADEVHVFFGVEGGRRPVVATDRRVGDQVDRARVRAHRGERFAADDLRLRLARRRRASSVFSTASGVASTGLNGSIVGSGWVGEVFCDGILRDLDLGDRVDRFAVFLIDHVGPTGLLRLAHRFDFFAVHFAGHQDGRARRVVSPRGRGGPPGSGSGICRFRRRGRRSRR